MPTSTLPLTTETTPGLRRLTSEEYHAMAEAGILHEDDRVELLDGLLVVKPAVGDPHVACISRLNHLLCQRTASEIAVSVQNPVRLGPHDEPEPDVVLMHGFDGAPQPETTLLLIEVSDTTLRYDRDVKLPRYAAAGIPEVWIVDLDARRPSVYRDPVGTDYRTRTLAQPGDAIGCAALPEMQAVPVAALFGEAGTA